MQLKAKIKPELLDLVLSGDKNVEVRSLETITLTDGKRTATFDIIGATTDIRAEIWADTLPQFFDKEHPIIALQLGRKLNATSNNNNSA